MEQVFDNSPPLMAEDTGLSWTSPPGEEVQLDALGVINALERTCALESALRQAIQSTHPLPTSLDWDFGAADRERQALLAITEHLEFLEDKLREFRFLGSADDEHKAVTLAQLDGVRRELESVVRQQAPYVVLAKEVVREVYAFACITDDDDDEEGLLTNDAPSSWTRPTVERVQNSITNPDSIDALLLSPYRGLRARGSNLDTSSLNIQSGLTSHSLDESISSGTRYPPSKMDISWKPRIAKSLLPTIAVPLCSNVDPEQEEDMQARLDDKARRLVAARMAREAALGIDHSLPPSEHDNPNLGLNELDSCKVAFPSPSSDLRRAVDRPIWHLEAEEVVLGQGLPAPGQADSSPKGFDMPIASPQVDAVSAAPWYSPNKKTEGPGGMLRIREMQAKKESDQTASPWRSPHPPKITGDAVARTDAALVADQALSQGEKSSSAIAADNKKIRPATGASPRIKSKHGAKSQPGLDSLLFKAARFGFVLTALALFSASAHPKARKALSKYRQAAWNRPAAGVGDRDQIRSDEAARPGNPAGLPPVVLIKPPPTGADFPVLPLPPVEQVMG